MLNLISLVFCLTFLPAIAASFDRLIPLPMLTREDMLQKLNTEELEVSSTAQGVAGEFKGRPVWERSKDGLLMPMVKIRVSVSGDENQQFHFKYKQKIYLPQTAKNQRFADLDYSIFDPDHLEVFQNGVKTGEVKVRSINKQKLVNSVLQDHSCRAYKVEVTGLEGEFLSIACELVREIRDGTIIPTLNLVWISSEYKTLDKARGPYIISFSEGRTARVQVVNDDGVKKEISFKVEFPDRMHRLRISGGLGPHIYRSTYQDQSSKSEVLPSAMLYANYYLNDIHALKFFEALVMKESVFNHAGVYLGSELGKFYDDRLILSSLIGLQGLSYRHDVGVDNLFTQIIYPQGVEIAMLHPFGLPNYRVTLGGFFSPQRDVIYQNFWARFGSRVFVEFNYINWEYGQRGASMYGLSVGFPLLRLF